MADNPLPFVEICCECDHSFHDHHENWPTCSLCDCVQMVCYCDFCSEESIMAFASPKPNQYCEEHLPPDVKEELDKLR